jgi:hypothetical protein
VNNIFDITDKYDIYTVNYISESTEYIVGQGSYDIKKPANYTINTPFSKPFYININIDTSACYIINNIKSFSIYKNQPYTTTVQQILQQYTANPTFFTNPSGAVVPEIIRRTTALTNSGETFMGIYITQLPDINIGILQYSQDSQDSGLTWNNVPLYIPLPYDTQIRFLPHSNTVTKRGQPAQFKFRAWEPFPLSPTTPKTAYTIIDPPVDPGRSLSELDFSQQEATFQIEIRDFPIILTRTPSVVFHTPILYETKKINLNWTLNTLSAITPNYSLYVNGLWQSTSTNTTTNYITTVYGNSYAFYATTVSGINTYYSNTQIVNIPAIITSSTPIISTVNLVDASFNIRTTNVSGDLSYALLNISGSNGYNNSIIINKSQIAPALNGSITISGILHYNSIFLPRLINYYTDNTNSIQWLDAIPISCPSGTTGGAINLSGVPTSYRSIKFTWDVSGIKTPIQNYISGYTIKLDTYSFSANALDTSATIETGYQPATTYIPTIAINYSNGTTGPFQTAATRFTVSDASGPLNVRGTSLSYKATRVDWSFNSTVNDDISNFTITLTGTPTVIGTEQRVTITNISKQGSGTYTYTVSGSPSPNLFGNTTYNIAVDANYKYGFKKTNTTSDTVKTAVTPAPNLSGTFLNTIYKSATAQWINISAEFIGDLSNIILDISSTTPAFVPLNAQYIIPNNTDLSFNISGLYGGSRYNIKLIANYLNGDISNSATRSLTTITPTISGLTFDNRTYKSVTVGWTLSGAPPEDISSFTINISGAQPVSISNVIINGPFLQQTYNTVLSGDINNILGGRTYDTRIIANYKTGYRTDSSFVNVTLSAGNLQPISVTGFNADIITNATDGSGNTNTGILGNATGAGNYILHMVTASGGLPTNGQISYNTANISGRWDLSNLTGGNNAMMLSGNDTRSLTFNSANSYVAISILGLASIASDISAIVNYNGDTSDVFSTRIPIYTWSSVPTVGQNMYNIATPVFRRATRENPIKVNTSLAADILRLYAYIMPTDPTKTIQSITIRNSTATSRVFILAVSGYT